MDRNELLQRSPVRVFDKAIDGGLKSGELGLVCSPPGMGKTSVLVQIALDKLLQGKKVIHISFTQNKDYVLMWYEDIFNEFICRKSVENERELKDEIVRNRILLNFNQEGVNTDVIRNSLRAMIRDGGYRAEIIVIDGFDFSIAQRDRFVTLKDFAREMGISFWYSCSVEVDDYDSHNVPLVLRDFEDCVDVVIKLETEADHARLSVTKNHGVYVNAIEPLRLDSKSLLLLE